MLSIRFEFTLKSLTLKREIDASHLIKIKVYLRFVVKVNRKKLNKKNYNRFVDR